MKLFVGFFVLVAAVAVNANDSSIKFEDCGKKEVKSIRCTACSGDPCELEKGKKASIEIDFVPLKAYDKVTYSVSASIFGIEMDLPVEDPNACSVHIDCPLKVGQTNTFKYELDVDDSYPSMNVNVKFALKSDNDLVACASTSVRLTDAEDNTVHDEF